MAVTNYSSARRAGFKVDNSGIKFDAAIAMTKIGTRTLNVALPPASWMLSGAGVVLAADGIFNCVTFPNANTGYMTTSLRIPAEAVASTDVTIDVYWKSAGITDDVKFSFSLAFAESGEAVTPTDTDTAVASAGTVANKLIKTSASLTTPFAVDDWVGFQLSRDPSDVLDTLASDIKIVNVVFNFTGRG